jgi:hypothetical protein
MVLFYNVAQPQNIKGTYSPFDQIDFLVKMPAGREYKKGSGRLSGTLKMKVTLTSAPTQEVDLTPAHQVNVSQFCGLHGLFRSFTTSINDQTVENIAYYPRWVAMKKQAENPQSHLYTSSENIAELTGLSSSNLLCGDGANGLSFSIKPLIAINKSDQNLPQAKVVQMRIMTQLSSSLEAFFSTLVDGNGVSLINSILYTVEDLQFSWYEEAQKTVGDIVLNTCYLNKQTVVSNHTNLNLFCPNVYDAVSVSFIRQADLNNIQTDNNANYLLPHIQRVEYTLNGNDAPISYPIESYQDLMINYKKSLMAGEKTCFSKSLISLGQCFGIGCSFPTSVNDKLGINMDISDVETMSANQFDAYMYVNGYLTL